jgi:hypothetical protein
MQRMVQAGSTVGEGQVELVFRWPFKMSSHLLRTSRKQQPAASPSTEARGSRVMDDLTPSQKETVAATRLGSRTPPAANKDRLFDGHSTSEFSFEQVHLTLRLT